MMVRRSVAITLLYISGLVAAASIGRLIPVLSLLQESLSVSFSAAAWAMSTVTLVAAVTGGLVSRIIVRIGAGPVLIGGLLLMSAGGAFSAMLAGMGTYFGVLAGRAVEGLGYVAIVVVAPALLANLAVGRLRSAVLAGWGTFIPVGIAVGSVTGATMAAAWGLQPMMCFGCVPPLLLAAAFVPFLGDLKADIDHRDPPMALASLRSLTWRIVGLAIGFGLLAVTGVVVIALLPSYLAETTPLGIASAGSLTALVAIASVVGSLGVGVALRIGLRRRVALFGALAAPAFALLAFLPSLNLGISLLVGIAALVMVSNGWVISTVFTLVPDIADGADRLVLANAMVVQFGSAGTLLGPPIFATAVSDHGWLMMPLLITAATVLGMTAISLARRPNTIKNAAA